MKYLKPIITPDAWASELDRAIFDAFRVAIYDGLLRTIGNIKTNAAKPFGSDLITAIRSGRIQYRDGVFSGELSASISRDLKEAGAAWDRARKGWRLPPASLPSPLRKAIEIASRRTDELLAAIKSIIDNVPNAVRDYVAGMNFDHIAGITEERMTKALRRTVSKEIGIEPTLSKDDQERLRDEYRQDVTRAIVKFSDDETERLREVVQRHIIEGRPRSELENYIMRRPGVSRERARFIARQETALFTVKLKQTGYQNLGIDRYRWKTTDAPTGTALGNVRPEHAKLHNRICSWDDPPLKAAQSSSGRDCHPGQDFNCRCVAIPIIEVIR